MLTFVIVFADNMLNHTWSSVSTIGLRPNPVFPSARNVTNKRPPRKENDILYEWLSLIGGSKIETITWLTNAILHYSYLWHCTGYLHDYEHVRDRYILLHLVKIKFNSAPQWANFKVYG